MRIYLARSLTIVLAVASLEMLAFAHGGGLNSEGCHNNRKTGGYHCHRSSYTPNRPTNNLTSATPLAPTAQEVFDDEVFAAQVVLKNNGCYSGALDGLMGPSTEHAIKLFEANRGMKVTGQLTNQTKEAIRNSYALRTVCR